MLKLLSLLVDLIEAFAKRHAPAIFSLINLLHGWRWLAMSRMALLSRTLGYRAIVAVGAFATLYALALFVTDSLIPDAPKASHDVILKNRLSSPVPSANILILDIDERSLAALAPVHGRWPWPRSVLADGLQKIADLGARAVLFNIMLSDPDKSNPDADAAMDITAQMIGPVAFPLIRLNPKNDKISQLKVAEIAGARIVSQGDSNATVAAILPMFGSMQNRLGVTNQRPDADGIVRKYPFVWDETRFTLPSIVKRTADLGRVSVDEVPGLISINWRNKNGRYARVSFSDLLNGSDQDSKLSVFKNAFVIIGLSAPGLGQTKGTSVSPLEDDTQILANALDDAINKTYLRTLPPWSALIINLITIWALVWSMIANAPSTFLNKGFLILQSGLGGITLLSASYTSYLIDLSESMSFGVAIFAAIKAVQSLDNSWSRAKPGFRKNINGDQHGELVLISYASENIDSFQSTALQRELEAIAGIAQVVRIDDLFGGESFIKPICARLRCLIVHCDPGRRERIAELIGNPPYAHNVKIDRHVLEHPWDPEDVKCCQEITPIILNSFARLLQQS